MNRNDQELTRALTLDNRHDFAADGTADVRSTFLRAMRGTFASPALLSTKHFYKSFTNFVYDTFGAQRVQLWELSTPLQLQRLSVSPFPDRILPDLVDAHSSLSLKAISEGQVQIADLTQRHGLSPLSDAFGDDASVAALPIHAPLDGLQCPFAITLHYDSAVAPSSRIHSVEAHLLCEECYIYFQHFLTAKSNHLRHIVDSAAASSLGTASLISTLLPELTAITNSQGLALVTMRNTEEVDLEFAIGLTCNRTFSAPSIDTIGWLSERRPECSPSEDETTRLLSWIRDAAQTSRGTIFSRSAYRSPHTHHGVHYFDEMIAPISHSNGGTIGFLWCHAGGQAAQSHYSHADLYLLNALAQRITPFVSRLLHVRAHSPLLAILDATIHAGSSATDVRSAMRSIIRNAVDALNASIGSVYLFNPTDNTLVMEAAAGLNERLEGQAVYHISEGLTGAIARERRVIRFNTRGDMLSDPRFAGKYDKHIWTSPGTQCNSFLGLPLIVDDTLIGVMKLGNVRRSKGHPDNYFTEHDVEAAKVVAALLAHTIANSRQLQVVRLWENALASTALAMLGASNEEEVLQHANHILSSLQFSSLLCLLDDTTQRIRGTFATGDKWPRILTTTNRDINGNDILAHVLRNNKALYIPRVSNDPRCNAEAATLAHITSFFVVPLRVNDELIGTLQVDFGEALPYSVKDSEKALHALASCIAYAISRVRALHAASRLAASSLSDGRNVSSDLAVAMVAHRICQMVDHVVRDIEDEVQRPTSRRKSIDRVAAAVRQLKAIEDALREYQLPVSPMRKEPVDILTELQRLVRDYQALAATYKCSLYLSLASDHKDSSHASSALSSSEADFLSSTGQQLAGSRHRIVADLPPSGLREIIRELFTNAFQAKAKRICVEVREIERYAIPHTGGVSAIVIDVSDDGIGISDADLERVGTPGHTTKPTGSGNGLYYCTRFARGFGGDIEIRRPDEGPNGFVTCMRVVIPRYVVV